MDMSYWHDHLVRMSPDEQILNMLKDHNQTYKGVSVAEGKTATWSPHAEHHVVCRDCSTG